MKKSLLLSLSLFAALGAFATETGDNSFVVDDLTYTPIEGSNVAVTDVARTLTSVVVPETVENAGTTYTVTAIGTRAFYYSKAASVELPNTVTELEYGAFMSSDLNSIKLGTGLKTIGDWAFAYTGISSIELPEGLEKIGTSSFSSCKSLGKIEFPASLKSIGGSCFYKVPITEINLPSGLNIEGTNTFLNCDKLEKVTFGEGYTAIGSGMFQSCTALKSIELPAGLKTIGGDAFLESGLTSITIPASVDSIGFSAFSAPNLATITVETGNADFIVKDEALYAADKTLLYAFPAASTTTSITVDAECLGICGAAFWKSGIEKVVLGDKMRAIDEYAFCFAKLKEINFPESLVYIGTEAFASTALSSVELPKALPMLQQAVFAGCESLTTVSLPASLTYIDIRAFWGCTALQTLNSYAMVPPVLEDWYEEYESPFCNVPSSCKLHVPAAALDAYKTAPNWKYAFSASNVIGDLASAPTPISYNPSDNSALESFDGADIVFGEEMSIVNSTPSIKVIAGSLVAGVPVGSAVSVDAWRVIKGSDANTIRIFPEDYDGYATPFNMELGLDYFITVPEGTVKNAAGEGNAEFTIHYEGTWVKPVVKLVSVDPADGSMQTEISTLTFTFEEPVTVVSYKLSSIKTTIGEMVDGVPTGSAGPEDYWATVYGQSSGNTVGIYASDYDGFTVPIPVQDGKNVYIQLPDGLFRLNSSYNTVSDAMTLVYPSKTTGIGQVEADLNAPVEIYTLDGVRVNNMTPGRVYIVRQGGKVTKQAAK